MPSVLHVVLCALAGLAFWTLVGRAIGDRLLPPVLRLPAAPVLGWAVHNVIALPIFLLLGFTAGHVVLVGGLLLLLCGASHAWRRGPAMADPSPVVPFWAYVCAALVAVIAAAAIMPKTAGEGMQLTAPMFDHAKLAMIDVMTRLGMPPANPFFGAFGERGRLAYYYLYYFGAAQFALTMGLTGWEADIAMTWFAAFASLSLVLGLAVWLGGRSSAAYGAAILAVSVSWRDTIDLVFGEDHAFQMLAQASGLQGWLFQATWVPQHLMSASCVVLALILVIRFSQTQTIAVLAALTLVIAAGFESSTYVGGVTFAAIALFAAPLLILRVERSRRVGFVLRLAAAGAIAALLASPFLIDQFATVGARHNGAPVAFEHLAVLGAGIPLPLRRLLDIPAYWLVLMPVEFPAIYVAGLIFLAALLTSARLRARLDAEAHVAISVFALAIVASLSVSWLLVSTLGYNNDLGFRGVLPGIMILIALAGAGLSHWRDAIGKAVAVAAACGFVIGLPGLFNMIAHNFTGSEAASSRAFAQTPQMWEAVRRYTPLGERVGNNPLFLADITPWEVNASWALLSNRSSCFAGRELALAYAPLSHDARGAIDMQFIRVFAGTGTAADVSDLAMKYGCRTIVVSREDKAWNNDPFAASPLYKRVEANENWRIYRSTTPDAAEKSVRSPG